MKTRAGKIVAKQLSDAHVKRAQALRSQLTTTKKRIGKERDRIRDMLNDFDELHGHCDEAMDDIERAIESLSRLC